MELRDELLGRPRTPGAVWAESPSEKEASELRDRARTFLDGQGSLSDQEVRRMLALIFVGRVRP